MEENQAPEPAFTSGDRLARIEQLRKAEAKASANLAASRRAYEAAAEAGDALATAKALERMSEVEHHFYALHDALAEEQAAAMSEWAIAASAEAAIRHGTSYTGLFDRKLTSVVRGTVRRWRKADLSEGPPSKEKVTTFATELGLDLTEPYRIYGWALPGGIANRGPKAPIEAEAEQVRELKRRLADPTVAPGRKRALLHRLRWLLIEDAAEAGTTQTGSWARASEAWSLGNADTTDSPRAESSYVDSESDDPGAVNS